jgi:hypothetical protein
MATYESSFFGQSCDRIGFFKDENNLLVCNDLRENYDALVTIHNGNNSTNNYLECVEEGKHINDARVRFRIYNPDRNYFTVYLNDNGHTETYIYDKNISYSDWLYLPWCGYGELTIVSQRSDVFPCTSCGGNCLVQDCPQGYNCVYQGGVYQCVQVENGCTSCGGNCQVQTCPEGQECRWVDENNQFQCVESPPPCTSCSGSCNLPTCGDGYECFEYTPGNFQCQELPFTVVDKWWFWLLIAVGIVIVIVIVIFVLKSTLGKKKKQVQMYQQNAGVVEMDTF